MKTFRKLAVLFMVSSVTIPLFAGNATNATSPEFSFSFTNIFPNSETAIQNGSNIVNYIESAQAEKAKELIGKYVALYGGVAPPGGNADLILDGGIRLKIDIDPPKDVRPQAVAWSVCVFGKITRVDVGKKIITIKVRPEDWRVMMTM